MTNFFGMLFSKSDFMKESPETSITLVKNLKLSTRNMKLSSVGSSMVFII